MPSDDANRVPSGEKDLEVLTALVKSGKLDQVLSKLDPDDVLATLRRVPVEIARLLLFLLSSPRARQQITTLREDQRQPLSQLLQAAEKYRGQEFLSAFVTAAKADDRLLRRLGLPATDVIPITATEAKLFNSVNKVSACPLLMLSSSRLYAEIGFFQNHPNGEELLLFRSTMELDEIVMVAEDLLRVAVSIIQRIGDKALALKPNVAVRRCTDLTKSIRRHVGELSVGLDKLARPASKNRRITPRRPAAQKAKRGSK